MFFYAEEITVVLWRRISYILYIENLNGKSFSPKKQKRVPINVGFHSLFTEFP